ncbi:MAG: hypothetical protein EA398_15670 [Deltaproteobacteria bacterium]|nr:MAG: hypothetical protein EA398_15670 [Deltaproteobacteria bacterium]
MSEPILLTALQGDNPGAFLAALGVLEVTTTAGFATRLRWTAAAGWRPVIEGMGSVHALLDVLEQDLRSTRDQEVLSFQYPKDEKKPQDLTGDLKPDPPRLRAWLEQLAADVSPDTRSSVDLAVALVPEGGLDRGGKAKPTAFHFTAGQQKFLDMVNTLRDEVTRDHLEEGLFGPWLHPVKLPSLGWDVGNSREYALRAQDPSTDAKLAQPGFEWLGLRGLRFLPTWAHRGQTVTTGVKGSWKNGSFLWPIWQPALSAAEVASLLAQRTRHWTPAERRARGIGTLYEARINRHDQGGYGSFRPPAVVP